MNSTITINDTVPAHFGKELSFWERSFPRRDGGSGCSDIIPFALLYKYGIFHSVPLEFSNCSDDKTTTPHMGAQIITPNLSYVFR